MKSTGTFREDIELRIMAYIDGELTDDEKVEIKKMIDSEKSYREIYNEILKLKEVTQDMKLKKLPEMYWDEYWQHIYNRIERGISWIFISVGAIIVLSYAVWNFVSQLIANQNLNPMLKIGIFILLIGAIILLVSVIREKLIVKKIDKYKEVER